MSGGWPLSPSGSTCADIPYRQPWSGASRARPPPLPMVGLRDGGIEDPALLRLVEDRYQRPALGDSLVANAPPVLLEGDATRVAATDEAEQVKKAKRRHDLDAIVWEQAD